MRAVVFILLMVLGCQSSIEGFECDYSCGVVKSVQEINGSFFHLVEYNCGDTEIIGISHVEQEIGTKICK